MAERQYREQRKFSAAMKVRRKELEQVGRRDVM
jgi:hypothetical protein